MLIAMVPGVDIIVPAGPGDDAWRGLLPQLAEANANRIALVLAGNDDPDMENPPAGLCIHRSAAGRAIQLNAGARGSDAAWLWFVHADSRVIPATLRAMQRFVDDDAAAIGYFRLRFLDDGPRLMFLNAWGAHFRSRALGLPFGDQGLLMPRRIFDVLGGFDESVAAGEDHDLIWSARTRGIPLLPVPAPIFTSARKYAKRGWWRTTREHLGMTRDQARRFSRRHAHPDSIEPS
ncbi:glycosyl transferase family 2 [Dokdonella sp.]|uniref:glycosyl transferase family 2 n=1 Tax=Dokdonella sp. TaxID=2291710 RepID=UPI0035281149